MSVRSCHDGQIPLCRVHGYMVMQNHHNAMVCPINAFGASASRMLRCEQMVVSITSAMVCHNTGRPHSQVTTLSVKVNQLSSPGVVDPILTNPAPYSVVHLPICAPRGTVVRKKSLEIHLSQVIPKPTTAIAYSNTSKNSISPTTCGKCWSLESRRDMPLGETRASSQMDRTTRRLDPSIGLCVIASCCCPTRSSSLMRPYNA